MEPSRGDGGQNGRKRIWSLEFGPFLTLGLQLAIGVVVFFFLGQWLDSRFGTSPWLMIVGIFIGVVGGLISFIRTAMRLGREEDEEERRKREG